MDIGMILLRIVHILSGVVWTGGALFLVLVLALGLRKLGPTVQGPVMRTIVPVFSPMFSIAALLLIGSGAWMALKLRWGILDTFFIGAWGWAILAGSILTVAALLVGMLIPRTAIDEAMELGGSIQGRITWSTATTAALLVGAVIAMASARWL